MPREVAYRITPAQLGRRRRYFNLSQEDCARAVGVPPSRWRDFEYGTGKPTEAEAAKIRKYLQFAPERKHRAVNPKQLSLKGL